VEGGSSFSIFANLLPLCTFHGSSLQPDSWDQPGLQEVSCVVGRPEDNFLTLALSHDPVSVPWSVKHFGIN